MFQKVLTKSVLAMVLAVAGVTSAEAAILSVAGPNSSSGFAPQKIAAPDDTRNNATPYSRQVGFDEKQGVVLLSSLTADGGTLIAAGLRVNSHMIYLERLRGPGRPQSVVHTGVDWTFDGAILGVMSSQNGGRERDSRAALGLDATLYAAFPNRGMEANDNYAISGNTLRVNMRVTEPGDWIRVVTLAPDTRRVPETGGWLCAVLAGLALAGVRRRLTSAAGR